MMFLLIVCCLVINYELPEGGNSISITCEYMHLDTHTLSVFIFIEIFIQKFIEQLVAIATVARRDTGIPSELYRTTRLEFQAESGISSEVEK